MTAHAHGRLFCYYVEGHRRPNGIGDPNGYDRVCRNEIECASILNNRLSLNTTPRTGWSTSVIGAFS